MNGLVPTSKGWTHDQVRSYVHQFQNDEEDFRRFVKANPTWRELRVVVEVLEHKEKKALYHNATPQPHQSKKFDFEPRGHQKVTGVAVDILERQEERDKYGCYTNSESEFTKCTDDALLVKYTHFLERFAQFLHFTQGIPSGFCQGIKECTYLITGAKPKKTEIGSKEYFLAREFSIGDSLYLVNEFRKACVEQESAKSSEIASKLIESFKTKQLVSKIKMRVDAHLLIKLNSFYGAILQKAMQSLFQLTLTTLQINSKSPKKPLTGSPKKRSPKAALLEKRSPHTPTPSKTAQNGRKLHVVVSPTVVDKRLSVITIVPGLNDDLKSP